MVTERQMVPDGIDVGESGDYVAVGFHEHGGGEHEGLLNQMVAFLTTEQARALYEKLYPYTFTPEEAAEMSVGET